MVVFVFGGTVVAHFLPRAWLGPLSLVLGVTTLIVTATVLVLATRRRT